MSSFSHEIASLPPDLQHVMMAELHKIATRFMLKESQGHTLQATALVNEVYVKLADKSMYIANKQHFIAIAAQQMRRILVDHARQKQAAKRGERPLKLTLADDAIDLYKEGSNDQLELVYVDELLHQLAAFDERAAQIFEIKLFSMLSNPEIAQTMNLSLATVERDLKAARAWFKLQLQVPHAHGSDLSVEPDKD